jgi:putative nucleotidyltransferase with HDIG domain
MATPDFAQQEILRGSLDRARLRFDDRERAAERLLGGGFVAAAVALLALAGDAPALEGYSPLTGLACIAAFALAAHIRIDLIGSCVVPTQLGFVPMLVVLPPAVVPVAAVAGLALGRLPDVLRGRVPASRLALTLGDAWFAVGPALVLVALGGRLGVVAVLLAALVAQVAFDLGGFAVRELVWRGHVSPAHVVDSAWVAAVDAALFPLGLLAAGVVGGLPWTALCPVPLLLLLAGFARERRAHLEQALELNDAYRGTALVLGDVVEADDGYTGEHCRDVVDLVLRVADELGLDPQQRRNLEFGALLHDVGKIAIPKDIINKPGALDESEWAIVRTHTLEGQRMLDRVGGFMSDVGLIVRSHHERWDGRGYPDALAGDAIPLEARIIACCDAYNAMTTDRAYRGALSSEVARAELSRGSGTQFDPVVVEAVERVIPGRAPNGRC